MTPEELDALPGLDGGSVPEIQTAVNNYYSQFEEAQQDQEVTEPAGLPEGEVESDRSEHPVANDVHAAAVGEDAEAHLVPVGESTENTTVSAVESARIGEKE
jgi:hypothetical protein